MMDQYSDMVKDSLLMNELERKNNLHVTNLKIDVIGNMKIIQFALKNTAASIDSYLEV